MVDNSQENRMCSAYDYNFHSFSIPAEALDCKERSKKPGWLESSFPRKSAASMLSGKKPVQASGSLPINKKSSSAKSGANRKGEGGGQSKASESVEYEDVEMRFKNLKPSNKVVASSSSEESSTSGKTMDDSEVRGTIAIDMPAAIHSGVNEGLEVGVETGNSLGLWFRTLVRPG
ncbi:hypothetical protein GIB67_023935, partial [Kingdonia uniflora]